MYKVIDQTGSIERLLAITTVCHTWLKRQTQKTWTVCTTLREKHRHGGRKAMSENETLSQCEGEILHNDWLQANRNTEEL